MYNPYNPKDNYDDNYNSDWTTRDLADLFGYDISDFDGSPEEYLDTL